MPPLLPYFKPHNPPLKITPSTPRRIIAPLPTSFLATPEDFKHDANPNIRHAIKSSWATSTSNGYKRAVQKFIEYCDYQHIPLNKRTPASEYLLCAFATYSLGSLSASSVNTRIAALKAWHIFNDWPWYGNLRLKQVLQGCKNLAPRSDPTSQKKHVTIDALATLAHHLDKHKTEDMAILACACTAFWAQCRLGELLPNSTNDFSTKTRPTKANAKPATSPRHQWHIFLPSTKTNQRGQTVVITRQRERPTIDPTLILARFLSMTKSLPQSTPLFAYNNEGKLTNLNKYSFLKKCNEIWMKTGYPRCTGHSFRIGGTTQLLLSGVSPDVVKTTGRWSSDAFLKYWRSIEDIAHLHMTDLELTFKKTSITRNTPGTPTKTTTTNSIQINNTTSPINRGTSSIGCRVDSSLVIHRPGGSLLPSRVSTLALPSFTSPGTRPEARQLHMMGQSLGTPLPTHR